MKLKITLFAIALITIFFNTSCSQNNPEITTDELIKHVQFLASDSLKGRYPGTPEDIVTANYIKDNLALKDFQLLCEDGLQSFEIISKVESGDENKFIIADTPFEFNKDFLPLSISANGDVSAQVSFLGYGLSINKDDFSWDDYKDINVEDKWVMVLKGDPDTDNDESPFIGYSDNLTKALSANEHKAVGVLLVSGLKYEKNDKFEELSTPKGNVDIPVVQISRSTANQILAKSGHTIEKLEEYIITNNLSKIIETDCIVDAHIDLFIDKNYTYNIISQLTVENSDEYIIIGGHYDHLGYGGPETGSRMRDTMAIHYGADDNASGVAAILEIAEKLVSVKEHLNRNIVFVAFGAEEMGLLGSKFFVNNPPVPLDKVVAMINLDMVGRMKDSSFNIGGTGTSPDHETILNQINDSYNFNIGFSPEGYGPSDHSSFYRNDIPVFFIFSGLHTDYHTSDDTPDKLNYDGLKDISQFTFDIVFDLATRDQKLVFQEAGPKVPSSRMARDRRFKVTLGIMPDVSGMEKRGLRADVVIKGKPAYLGGMQDGDIITAIDGKPVGDVYQYMSRLSKLEAGQTITVDVIRNEEKKVLLIQL